jgi:hypothetical protein
MATLPIQGCSVFVLAMYGFLSGVCRVKMAFRTCLALALPIKPSVTPDGDSGCRGFESHPPPHPSCRFATAPTNALDTVRVFVRRDDGKLRIRAQLPKQHCRSFVFLINVRAARRTSKFDFAANVGPWPCLTSQYDELRLSMFGRSTLAPDDRVVDRRGSVTRALTVA